MRFIIIFFLLLSTQANAVNYYIRATGGNDANNGTSYATAWASPSKLNDVDLNAGDFVYFDGNFSNLSTITFTAQDSGVVNNPVTVTSYSGSRIKLSFVSNVGGLVFDDVSHLRLSNIETISTGIQQDQLGISGISIRNTISNRVLSDVVVNNCAITDFNGDGFFLGSTAIGGKVRGVVVSYSRASGCVNGFGVWSDAEERAFSDLQYLYDTAVNNHGKMSISWVSGFGLTISHSAGNVLFDGCYMENNGSSGRDPVGFMTYLCTGVTIQNSISINNKSGTAADGGGFDFDGGSDNCIMQYNYSANNLGAGFMIYSNGTAACNNNIIRYNVSVNDGRASSYSSILLSGNGTAAEGRVTNNQIYNNTIYLNSSNVVNGKPYGLGVGLNLTGLNTFTNNTIHTFGSNAALFKSDVVRDTSVFKMQANNYYADGTFSILWAGTNYTSLAAWKAAAPTQERRGATSYDYTFNPTYVASGTWGNYYKLQATSPLIDKGIAVANNGGRDYFGTTIANPPDVGFSEVTGSPPPSGAKLLFLPIK